MIDSAGQNVVDENLRLREENADLKLEVSDLLAKLRFISGQKFATSKSEKLAPLQGSLFNEAEATIELAPETEPTTVKGHERKAKRRKSIPAHIVRDTIQHDLTADEKVCSQGHGQMEKTGTSTVEKLQYQPAKFRVDEHICAVYKCAVCDEKKTAKIGICDPLPGTIASPSLLAHLAAGKYLDHLPLYRQEGILARQGILISRTTLATWMIKVAERVTALVNMMCDHIRDHGIVQMDETRIQVLSLPGKIAKSNSFMWVMAGGPTNQPAVVFEFDPSRGGAVAQRLLQDFKGYLQADGYGGYNAVAKQEGVLRVGCLMHIRRPFNDAYQELKGVGGGEIAKQALAFIQDIYKVEKEAKSDPSLGRSEMSADERRQLRQLKSVPILEALLEFAKRHLPLVRPKSTTGKALSYCINEWPNFIRYLDDGRLEVDNGRAERAIRPLALGRRNWLFADTASGASASATLYSLIETAKLNGREPTAYLRYIFERVSAAVTADDLEALLPWNATLPPG